MVNEHQMAMEAATGPPIHSTDGDALTPRNINEQLQVPDDSQSTDPTTLPGLCAPDTLPPVLYRWSNPNSQGINNPSLIMAGMFAKSNSVTFSPADLNEDTFLGYVKSHVTKAPVKSPFISAFQSLLAPVHRALHNSQGAMISVIDTAKVPTEVFKAVPLVELTKTALINWKGYGEYLIWGEVPASAIACTFTISKLQEIATAHCDIGQFLQLEQIRERHHCSRFLYSDLAANVPPSQDDHAEILDRLTGLLELCGNVKALVAQEFHHTWTKKFRGVHYERPEGHAPILPEDENRHEFKSRPARLTGSSVSRPWELGLAVSESSWQPSASESDDDSRSSITRRERSVGSEEVVKCPRCDTPSDGYYSVHDDSSDEDERRDPLADYEEFKEQPEINERYLPQCKALKIPTPCLLWHENISSRIMWRKRSQIESKGTLAVYKHDP